MGRHSRGLSPTIKQLQPWHKSIARLMVAEGCRPGELARRFRLTPSQISVIINSPLFIMERERLESLAEIEVVDMRTELELRQPLALEAIDRGLHQDDADKAASIGFGILDRTGYGKRSEPQKHLHLHAHKEVKDLEEEELLQDAMDIIAKED